MNRWLTLAAAAALVTVAATPAAAECTMDFTLSGWSAFYKSATGDGKVTCNGRSARVDLRVQGGGFTFGSSRFAGTGTFAGADSIEDVTGSYFRMAAEGGPAGAYSYSKGPVRLAVTGTGTGFTLGWDMGNLTITRK